MTYYSNDGTIPTIKWYRIVNKIKEYISNQHNKVVYQTTNVDVLVPFYSARITQAGFKSQLTIIAAIASDFGEYVVEVSNSIGKTVSRIRFAVEGNLSNLYSKLTLSCGKKQRCICQVCFVCRKKKLKKIHYINVLFLSISH